MAITKDLFLSILAMDSYNRGYEAGIDGLGETTGASRIGGATISYTLADAKLSEKAQASGFYAIAYDTPYGTVISYRGTDTPNPLAAASDFWSGWTIGSGFIGESTQADEALAFYSAVTGKDYWDGPAANTIVTGHSLGGGLAGFVSFLSGTEGVGFDHMPFGIAAALQNLSAPDNPDSTDHQLDTSKFKAYYTSREVLQYLRSGIVPSILGGLVNPYLGMAEGEATAYYESLVPKTVIDSHGGLRNPIDLHSQSLLVTLQFAHENKNVEWQSIGSSFLDALFNSEVAKAAGFDPQGINGKLGEAAKLMTAVAYSVLDEGQLVFGDSGVRAMFDDLDDLGRIYKQEDHDAFLDAYVTQLDSVLPLPELATVRSLLVRTVVEYAGALALNKVTRSGVKQQIDGVDVEEGVIAISDDAKTLALDLSSVLWGDVLKTGTAGSRVVIPEDMLRELSDKDDGVYRAVRSFRTRHKADGRVISPEYDLGETLRQADPNVNLANAGDDGIKHLMAGSVPDAVMALRETAFVPPPSL